MIYILCTSSVLILLSFYLYLNGKTLRLFFTLYPFYRKLFHKYMFPKMKYKVPKTHVYDYDLPPFPNTWYPIGMSYEINCGKIYHKKIAGQEIVVYRSDKTKLCHVQSRYCPHMGVDLAYGMIRNDCIICPFHHHCMSPNKPNQTIREKNKRIYHVEEVQGIIFLWISTESEKPLISIHELFDTFFPDKILGFYRTMFLERQVGGHIVDYAEHLLDVSHAPYTHGVELLPVENMLQTYSHSFQVQFQIKGSNFTPNFTYMTPTFGYVDYGHNVRTFIMFIIHDVGNIEMVQLPYMDSSYKKTFYSFLGALYTHFDFSEEAAFFSTKKHRKRCLTKSETPMNDFREWFANTYYSNRVRETFYTKQYQYDRINW